MCAFSTVSLIERERDRMCVRAQVRMKIKIDLRNKRLLLLIIGLLAILLVRSHTQSFLRFAFLFERISTKI